MKQKTTTVIQKCLSLLLAVAMLLTTAGIPSQAKMVTEDNATAQQTRERELPKNPVHHCMKDDATDWSYVYFGSYPQTEVTGDALTSAITGASYDANGDAWVDDTKYRRISENDTNNAYYFGDSEYRYFKWERIKWRVLSNDGNTLFVAADQGLDCKDYHEENTSITWENCTLRSWLNSSFYQTAFSSAEQGAIVEQNVVNDDNPNWGTEGGNNTNDKVYLLSIGEVTNPAYGFCEDYYGTYSVSRRLKASDYAHARGAYINDDNDYAGNCLWWLRSPGYRTYYAADVSHYGCVDSDRSSVDGGLDGVVPALHINLSSDFWSLTDDGSSGEVSGTDGTEKKELPKNPVHHCTKDDATDWSYVCFGSYPQTEVTGDALTSAITGASYDANGDAWVDGTKYCRISKSDTNNTDYFGDSEYRYFKWERIKWRVLQNDGSTLFVAADQGLDCKDYNEEDTDITWENCTLRSWLNSSFYQTAFSSAEQGAVVEQNVVNDDNPEYGTEGGNNTNDKVYLLSTGETTNLAYGFCEDDGTYSVSRLLKTSDYAHARGAYINDDNDYAGNCLWWLRSPGNHAGLAALVSHYGYVCRNGYPVNISDYAVVPALHINLSSDLWSLADDGSSGEGGDNGTGDEPPICTEHTWSEGTVTKAPTCTQKGEKEYTCTVCGETKTEEIEATGRHTWDKGKVTKAPTCTQKGEKEYTCTVCGETKTEELAKTAHTYQTIITKATTAKNGSTKEKCSGCGEVKNQKTIFAVKSAALKTSSYTYNGKKKKPSVTVKDSQGKVIGKGNYTLTYQNNTKVGKATVTIKLKGNYTGKITKTFQIIPKGTSISGKIMAKSKGLTVKWEKQPKSTTGYQIQVSTSKKFAKKATVTKTVKKNSITKLTVKKLKPKKKYYVRIRTYKTVKGKNYCSNWSKAKTVTTKK